VDVRAGSQWIPLDAALYSPGPADAARFSFFTSALEEGTLTGLGSLATLFGNIDVQVMEYTIAGRPVTVPADAAPFSVSGNTYRNPWLGLTVEKPSAFRFTSLDAVWPARTLLAMEGPGGQVVELQSESASLPVSDPNLERNLLDEAEIQGTTTSMELAGRHVEVVSAADRAGLVLARRGGVFLLKSSGPDAKNLLVEVASKMKLDE
jgi:hypothetical protein